MYKGKSEGISKVVNFMLPHFMPTQKVLVLKNNVQQYRNWLGLSYQSIAIQGKDCDGLIKRTRRQSPTITAPSNRMNLWRMRLIFTYLVMSFEMVLKFVNLTEKWCHCSLRSVYTPRASVQVITQNCVQIISTMNTTNFMKTKYR